MAVKVVIGIYMIAVLIALLHPRFAILFFWPVLYCYPHWLLWGKLPLNIGLDDVFLVCLFMGSLIRSGGKLQVKGPFIAAILFWVIFVLGDLTSVMIYGLNITLVWQQWLKSLGLVFFVFCVSAVVKTPEDIRRMIYSLLFGAFVGAVFIIYYTVFPYAHNPFQIPYWISGLEAWSKQTVGPFASTAIAAGVLGFAILIGYFYIRLAKDRFKRPFILIVTGILVFSLVLCTARKGWVFVLFPVVLSTVLSKQRTLGILMLLGIAMIVVATYTHSRVFSERLAWTVWQMTGGLQSATSNRYEMWVEHLTHPKISWLFCGEGFAMMEGAHTHNNYIGILKGMGFVGVLFWSVYYVKVMKKCSWLKRYDPNPDMAILSQAVFWCYIGYFVFFMPSTPVMWPNVRYIDFFLMTLIHLRYKQLEVEQANIYYEEQYEPSEELYEPSLAYAGYY